MKLFDQYAAACRVRRLAPRTIQTYRRWMEEFLRFHHVRSVDWIHDEMLEVSVMPKTTGPFSVILAMLLCLFGCSTKGPAPANKPSDSPVSKGHTETPTGDETVVAQAAEPQPAEPEPEAWMPFSSPSGHYSVLLPGAAQVLPSNRPTIKNHGVSLPNGRIYMVSESPQTRFDDPAEIAEALAAARDAHLGNKQALFEDEISLGGDKGLAYAFVDADDVWEARIFLRGDTLYQLYAVVPKAAYVKGDPEVAQFFDSFRIIAPKEDTNGDSP